MIVSVFMNLLSAGFVLQQKHDDSPLFFLLRPVCFFWGEGGGLLGRGECNGFCFDRRVKRKKSELFCIVQ